MVVVISVVLDTVKEETELLVVFGDGGGGILVRQQCEKNSSVVMLGEDGPEDETKDGGPDQPKPEGKKDITSPQNTILH